MTYSLLGRSFTHSEAICQYCIWLTYLMSRPEERAKYFISIGAKPEDSASAINEFGERNAPALTMCPYPRPATHVPYIGRGGADPNSFVLLAEKLTMEGICQGSDLSASVDCLTERCQGWGHNDSTLQRTVTTWEKLNVYVSAEHEKACSQFFRKAYEEMHSWQRRHDSMDWARRQLCDVRQRTQVVIQSAQ